MHSTNTSVDQHTELRAPIYQSTCRHTDSSADTPVHQHTHNSLMNTHLPHLLPLSTHVCDRHGNWFGGKNSRELQINKTVCTLCSRLLYLLTDFHFQLNWSFRKSDLHHTKEYVTVVSAVYYLKKKNHTYKQSFKCPTGFSCLRPTRPVWLLVTYIHPHLSAWLQVSNSSPQFTNRATDMVNLSEHLHLSQPKHAVEMTAFKPNVCPWVNSSGCTHN